MQRGKQGADAPFRNVGGQAQMATLIQKFICQDSIVSKFNSAAETFSTVSVKLQRLSAHLDYRGERTGPSHVVTAGLKKCAKSGLMRRSKERPYIPKQLATKQCQ